MEQQHFRVAAPLSYRIEGFVVLILCCRFFTVYEHFVWVCSTADRRFYAKAEGVVILQYAQPGQQRLDANQKQHDTTDSLSRSTVLVAEQGADLHADGGQQAGGDADERSGRNDSDLHSGKADADGKSINAGGNSQRQHGLGRVVVVQLLIAAEALLDHVCADECQQHKSDPGAELRQQRGKAVAQEIAQRGHQELEPAEPDAAGQGVGQAHLANGQALADR